ncbi:MAG: hypothetical protein AAF846_20315 [Chloroflexota bacterium]
MSERNEARRQVFGTLLTSAVLRWESLVTLLMTLILFIGVGGFDVSLLGLEANLPAVIWLLLGAGVEATLVLSMLTDSEATQEALAREFENKYDLTYVSNSTSRERLRTAMEYRRNMLKLLKRHTGGMRVELRDTLNQVNNWIAAMYDLAIHIDSFEGNELVKRDVRTVPQQIERVKARIEREQDERVRDDLERQLRLLEQQKANLQQTQNSIKRAEIQLETTLSSLGTVYAQMSLLGTRGSVDGSKQQRMRLEIQDEVMSLQDTIEAMEEVQGQMMRLR